MTTRPPRMADHLPLFGKETRHNKTTLQQNVLEDVNKAMLLAHCPQIM